MDKPVRNPTRHALMLESLDAVAEADIDIVPVFFAAFLDGRPDEAAMFHNRAASHGAMVNEMLTMLLAQADGEGWVPLMMRAQVTTHYDHGDIALQRYRDALNMLVDVLAETAGLRWLPAYDSAWRSECERLMTLIARYH